MNLPLADGSRVGVIGGGPAGSMFAYFLLTLAERVGLEVAVDIYEPRDFLRLGPAGCNMCGGIVSESLVQNLAAEGINLPTSTVQKGIDSYVLHTEETSVRIETPLGEKRIAAVHRGGGPRDAQELQYGGLDGYLMNQAQKVGAVVRGIRVSECDWKGDRPRVWTDNGNQTYDLLVGATGVNSVSWQVFSQLGIPSVPPRTTKTYITELKFAPEDIVRFFGNSVHIFLLDIPRLECAAIIPKGDYATLCLLGREVDIDLVKTFLTHAAVKRCLPDTWNTEQGVCRCFPKINIGEATVPFMDRVVLVGDCGASRLYKDGIGAAYRTGKAAAVCAVFEGVSGRDFRREYWPTYRSIVRDNRWGRLIFSAMNRVRTSRLLMRGVTAMAATEQREPGEGRDMSIVLWDMFTGSAPYHDIARHMLKLRFISRLIWECGMAVGSGGRREAESRAW